MKSSDHIWTILCFSLLLMPIAARAQERILSYHSDITVHTNAEMIVTETIRVRAEGQQVRRGIFRDFPTGYRDRYGNRVRVDFELLDVQRDGRPEPHHTQSELNSVKVYIGREDVFLDPGEYTYAITYRTSHQLGFFENHDELYWNVTGNEWAFAIETASASVTLPESVPLTEVTHEGYTGVAGSKATFLESEIRDGRIHYRTTRPLGPREGLTIVATWPKGHVEQPSTWARAQRMLAINRSFFAGIVGFFAVLGYYLVVWSAVGKDPAKGVIIPQFKPPDGISPAAARFIREMGYDHKCFAAGIIDMAVHGTLRIRQEGRKFTIERVSPPTPEAPPEEQKLYNKLLSSFQTLTFEQKNHHTIGKAVTALRKSLAATYEKQYFLRNGAYWAPGILIALVTVLGVTLLGPQPQEAIFLGVWLTIWTFAVMALLMSAGAAWRSTFGPGGRLINLPGAIFSSLFALPFLAGEVVAIFMLGRTTSPLAALCLVAIAILLWLFYTLMKAPTLLGRKVMDHLDGLRMYMAVAEKDRLRALHPPKRTPEHFEELLPYALALDVEQEWAGQFADILQAAAQGPTSGSRTAYSPGWYTGPSRNLLTAGALAGAVGGALTSAISSSSTAPGSSSGSGGGGSSGGGGGGGGGGGW